MERRRGGDLPARAEVRVDGVDDEDRASGTDRLSAGRPAARRDAIRAWNGDTGASDESPMRLFVTTFFVAFVSALIPLVNIEAYLATVGALVDRFGLWPVAFVAALGQSIGKAIWYAVGRQSLKWAYIQKKIAQPKWQQHYERTRERAESHALGAAVLVFLSATLGFPPMAVVAVIAGQLRFHRWVFYSTTLIGRTIRFAALLGGISLLAHSGLFD
jgi:membrane protein YqaA with SNARE-associated domain